MDVKNVDGLEYLATIPEVDRPYPDRSAVYHFAGRDELPLQHS
jgi:hypothetical protein